MDKKISYTVISRLPRYYRYLGELQEEGIDHISSKDLSIRMSVTASQIRQDLNNFGGFGQQGYGYNVEYLYNEIGKILGIDQNQNIIIVGAGHLGQALANYANFRNRGFRIMALFDKNPEVIGKVVNGSTVYDIKDLENYLKNNTVHIAAICIPKSVAGLVAQTLIDCGIKAIWNFAHLDIKTPDDVVIENVHLSESLMRLSYKANVKNLNIKE